jgi:RNA polymerase sigma-70 factor, ECF subfamily
MQSYTDEQLMHIFQHNMDNQGSKALDCLYQRYAQKLLNYFYFSLNKDHAKAQDFVQDVFIKLLENPHHFDARQPFKPWVFRVASNLCKNDLRSLAVMQKYQKHTLVTSPTTEEGEPYADILKICLDRLGIDQRSLIVLRFKLKLSVKEIAEIYECPEGTVKSRLFYAIKELSKLYNQ